MPTVHQCTTMRALPFFEAIAVIIVGCAIGLSPQSSWATPATAVDKTATAYKDGKKVEPKGTFSLSAAGRAIGGTYTPFAVDTTGAQTSGATEISTRLSLVGHIDTHDILGKLRFEAHVGVDLARGTLSGQETLAGDGLPATTFDRVLPTDAWVGMRLGKTLVVRVGQMTSNWGLGLIASDGKGYMDARKRDWFMRTETGDRVLRGLITVRPFANDTSILRGLVLIAAIDKVVADDILLQPTGQASTLFNEGRQEEAVQGIASGKLFLSKESWFGFYYVYRDQQHKDGKWLKVHAGDVAADLRGRIGHNELRVRAEAVYITGQTTLSPSPLFPEHEVRQAAVAGQARLLVGKIRFEFDTAWMSGDNNFDDRYLTQFKSDQNYQLGLILFPRVLAAWTGRSRLTASNPDVVGVPNEDLSRLGTRGSVTSTIAFFPKVGMALPFGLDIYGGALFAFAPSPPADPFHTKTAGGGEGRNALNKPQGASLGIELDLGIRYTVGLPIGSALTVGVEYGILLPGSALAGLGNVQGGRLTLTFAPNVGQGI